MTSTPCPRPLLLPGFGPGTFFCLWASDCAAGVEAASEALSAEEAGAAAAGATAVAEAEAGVEEGEEEGDEGEEEALDLLLVLVLVLVLVVLLLSSVGGSSEVGVMPGKRERSDEESLRTSGFVSLEGLEEGLDDDRPADAEVEEEEVEEEGVLVDDGMF